MLPGCDCVSVVSASCSACARAQAAADAARQIKISATVGAGGRNVKEDVGQVQAALNRHGATLDVDGLSGPKTIGAIRKFQTSIGFRSPDGRDQRNAPRCGEAGAVPDLALPSVSAPRADSGEVGPAPARVR